LLYTHSPKVPCVNWYCDMDQGHEDTMMGSHHEAVTACSVGCSILEYLMEMM
ncbi:hypothetical protein Bca52824_095463, partial [Brassica carinata]